MIYIQEDLSGLTQHVVDEICSRALAMVRLIFCSSVCHAKSHVEMAKIV